jgi:hypothetical protein
MEPVEVARQIETCIRAIGEEGKLSPDLIEAKAKAQMEYDKALACEVLRLKEDGIQISIVEKVAKGNISDAKYGLELAEAKYKANFSRLDCLKAQLNGLQSINRHLSVI